MEPIRKILVTTDFSPTAAVALDPAKEFARRFDAEVILLHVIDDGVLPLYVEYVPVALDEIRRKHEEQSRRKLEELAKEAFGEGAPVQCRLAEGIPHQGIIETAEEVDADMIVIATHGRGFFSHAILGSTAERVLRRATCPVLVVRDARQHDDRKD